MKNLIVAVIAALAIMPALAGPRVGTRITNSDGTQSIVVATQHDTTGRTDADLTERERHFLSTVPMAGDLRKAVREMVLANVVHVPDLPCGNYTPGDSVRYWTAYQAWTGPRKVVVPLTPGPQGEPGPQGPRGPRGEPGRVVYAPALAPAQNITYNYNLAPSYYPSCQMGGMTGASSNTWQLLGVSTTSPTRISVMASATGGAGGAGGSTGPIDIKNTSLNTNVVSSANNLVLNNGPGTATGSADATGTGSSKAGN